MNLSLRHSFLAVSMSFICVATFLSWPSFAQQTQFHENDPAPTPDFLTDLGNTTSHTPRRRPTRVLPADYVSEDSLQENQITITEPVDHIQSNRSATDGEEILDDPIFTASAFTESTESDLSDECGCGTNCRKTKSISCRIGNKCCLLSIFQPSSFVDNVTYWAGFQGFKGPLNRGGDSSFGLNEGVNLGFPITKNCNRRGAWGGQFGLEATQSNLSGSSVTLRERNQIFFTGGIFRRSSCGLQGGVVYDYLFDSWDTRVKLGQIRSELSWVNNQCHEIGFWSALSVQNDTIDMESSIQLDATDVYAFFYRHHFESAAVARAYGGWTDNHEGLLGIDFRIPLSSQLAIDATATYLVPDEGTRNFGHLEESWNVGLRLIWYPRFCAQSDCRNLSRPLFNVANNGSFFIDN